MKRRGVLQKLRAVRGGLPVEVCPHPSVPIWIVDRTQEAAAKQRV